MGAPDARDDLSESSSVEEYLQASLLGWLNSPDQSALTSFTDHYLVKGLLRPERARLNRAWVAYASGDFQRALEELPEQLSDFGSSHWSFAAEAAFIRALIHYCTGQLEEALTYLRLAQVGLHDRAREIFLLPTLLIQSLIAFHNRQRDFADSTWQAAAHLAAETPIESGWKKTIAAIAHVGDGNFDQARDDALAATALFKDAGPHFPIQAPWLLLGQMVRDQGDAETSAHYLSKGIAALDDFPALPLHAEFLATKAHLAVDEQQNNASELVDGVAALSSHLFATGELQEQIDYLEAGLRIRTNEMTRARVIANRLEKLPRREFIEAVLDAETRPSKTLGVLAAGKYRWYRDQIEVEIIRARARRKDPHAAAVQIWRAIERASNTGSIRPFLEVPIAALNFSNPEMLDQLDATKPGGEEGSRAEALLERILEAHSRIALTGPASHALSSRELEILRAVAAGGDFNTVAKVLVVSPWTVRGHFYSACRKLGVSGKDAAISKLREIETPRPEH